MLLRFTLEKLTQKYQKEFRSKMAEPNTKTNHSCDACGYVFTVSDVFMYAFVDGYFCPVCWVDTRPKALAIV
jgi:hypothetical protein